MRARERLAELKAANLPHATWRDLATLKYDGPPTPEEQADLDAIDVYLAAFLPPSKGCICCDAEQSGFMAGILGTGFRWGLAHGEGACATCGWPARAYHRDFGPVKFLRMILQYHPDGLDVEPPVSVAPVQIQVGP